MNSSKRAGQNGAYIETLILGHPSNPSKLVDDEEHNTEIKSCRERHAVVTKAGKPSTRMGQFKINFEQHRHLVETDGSYLFAVQNEDLGVIIQQVVIKATEVEQKFHILDRVMTKHHYYSINWRKVFEDATATEKQTS